MPLTQAQFDFEALIVETSAALIGAATDDVDAAVAGALERLRVFFDADRAGLLTVDDDRTTVRITHEAYGPGVPRVPTTMELERLFPWSYRRAVIEQLPVVVPRVADLPPAADADRATWTTLGAGSNLTVPVVLGGTVTHLVTMGAIGRERAWPLDYIPRIRLMGEMMAAAIRRARALVALRAREAEVREKGARLEAANDELKQLRERLERENVDLRRQVSHERGPDLVSGRGPAVRRVLDLAEQVAPTSSTVLLMGETGTGKERFAEYVHQLSPRSGRHMVRVNCSAIPAALIESELFGREKGAYTGALTRQVGRFELAHGSTLFLDEIGDLPLDVQVKLLRVLQERTIERLGSPTPVPVDVRIIAATNRDLLAAMRAGTFRSDLFYRLNVFPIAVPPLRERREDIPMLVEALIEELGTAVRKHIASVDPSSLEAMVRYDWPGNVRELRNVLERAMILSSGPTLRVDVPGVVPSPAPHRPDHVASPAQADRASSVGGLRGWERDEILRVLNEAGWRIRGTRGAAAVLDLKPTTLEKRMARLGIRRPSARQ